MSEKLREKKDGQDASKNSHRSDDTHRHDHHELDAQTGHKNEGPLDNLNRDDFDRDLRPHERQGENSGANLGHDPDTLLRAADDKDLVNTLQEFHADDLRRILILPRGTRLQQGAHYVDLNDPDRMEIVASGTNPVTPHLEAQENQRLVPKSETDYELWDKLTGKGDRINPS